MVKNKKLGNQVLMVIIFQKNYLVNEIIEKSIYSLENLKLELRFTMHWQPMKDMSFKGI